MPANAKKIAFYNCFSDLVKSHNKAMIVNADNVTSQQLHNIRKALRGKAVVKFGKNKIMKLVINDIKDSNILKIIPHLKGNVGLIFTDGDLVEIRDLLRKEIVQAPAKADAVAPKSVKVPKQITTLGPEKTSFFQALQIPTKITRGTIEIINDVDLITEGDIVSASQAALLSMLKIHPFEYGLRINQIYEKGSCYSPDALDITEDDLKEAFLKVVQHLAAVSLAVNRDNLATVPHKMVNTIKSLLAVSIGADIELECTKEIRDYLADPSKFAVAAAAAPVEEKVEKVEEAPKEESESDDDSDIGMGLFD